MEKLTYLIFNNPALTSQKTHCIFTLIISQLKLYGGNNRCLSPHSFKSRKYVM